MALVEKKAKIDYYDYYIYIYHIQNYIPNTNLN